MNSLRLHLVALAPLALAVSLLAGCGGTDSSRSSDGAGSSAVGTTDAAVSLAAQLDLGPEIPSAGTAGVRVFDDAARHGGQKGHWVNVVESDASNRVVAVEFGLLASDLSTDPNTLAPPDLDGAALGLVRALGLRGYPETGGAGMGGRMGWDFANGRILSTWAEGYCENTSDPDACMEAAKQQAPLIGTLDADGNAASLVSEVTLHFGNGVYPVPLGAVRLITEYRERLGALTQVSGWSGGGTFESGGVAGPIGSATPDPTANPAFTFGNGRIDTFATTSDRTLSTASMKDEGAYVDVETCTDDAQNVRCTWLPHGR